MKEYQSANILVIRCGRLKNQHHITTLLTHLAGQGHSVRLFAIQCPKSDITSFRNENPNIKVVHVGEYSARGILRFIYGGLALNKLLKSYQADIFYVIDSWTLRYFSVASFLSVFIKRVPIIYHTFDMLSPGVAAWYERLLECFWAKRADLVVVTDSSRSALMKAMYRLPNAPLEIGVYMPKDYDSPSSELLDRFRSTVLKNCEDKLIISPTRLSEDRKGLELLEAFAGTPVNYVLLTYEGMAEYTHACKNLAKSLGISERVLILPESSSDEVILATASSDLALIFHDQDASLGNFFCHPSRLAYCLALGIPVVANAVPSIESIVYKHNLGLCVRLNHKDEFVNSITELCNNQNELLKKKIAIKTAFKENLCFENQALGLNMAIKRILDSGSE